MDFWEARAKEQKEDLETDKIREDIKLMLTDKQYNVIKLLAYKANFNDAGEFLASFVGDLTEWHSNGSDERDYADQWYRRAYGYVDYYSYFRYHLFNYDYCIDDMKKMLENEDYFEEVYEEYKNESCSQQKLESKDDCKKLLKELIEADKEL